MKFYHVSDDPDITEFIPRLTNRPNCKGLVWALDERGLINFMTPRNCPRVYYYAVESSTEEDISKYFASSARHGIAIENIWHDRMAKASIYIYEFDAGTFYSDGGPGYYISEQTQVPLSVTKVDNLFERLFEKNVEVRILPNLHQLKEAVMQSTLKGGMMRTGLAQPKQNI